MTGVATDNSTLLFVNITGPTDGRHREPSVQTKIRQHVVRDITKAHRKPPRNRRSKLNTAALLSKTCSSDTESNAIVFGARSHKGHTEKEKDEKVTSIAGLRNISPGKAPAVIVPTTANNESALNIPKNHSSECQHDATLLDLAVEQDPLSVLYQRLVGTSKLPAYSLAYAVIRNVNPNRK
jgi:phenylalanyl-tRNA synthetase alpha subunit